MIPATLKILREEHRALSALLRSMSMLVNDAHRRNALPDFRALRAMLFYVEEFPERLHHPKESQLLFPLLKAKSDEAAATIAHLDRDHAAGERTVHELQHLLTAWEMLGPSRRADFETALDRYVEFYLNHMRLEETEVLPLAQQLFSDEEWRELDARFAEHRDALAGAEPETVYRDLFRTIVNTTPAPIGLA